MDFPRSCPESKTRMPLLALLEMPWKQLKTIWENKEAKAIKENSQCNQVLDDCIRFLEYSYSLPSLLSF